MVLDSLSSKERQGLVAVFAALMVASVAAGYMGANSSVSPTSDSASEDEIRNTVQSLMDQQIQRQEQQMALVAQQNPNISADDLSMEANVVEVTRSDFEGLYKVRVSIEGETPSRQNPGETESISQEQVVYISNDGRYLFRQPTDLEAEPEQPQQQPAPEEQ